MQVHRDSGGGSLHRDRRGTVCGVSSDNPNEKQYQGGFHGIGGWFIGQRKMNNEYYLSFG